MYRLSELVGRMATKKKPRKIPLPTKWWREPFGERRLKKDDNAEYLISQARKERLGYIQDAIRELRTVAKGYEARDGYPLDSRKLVRISQSSYDKIRRDILKIRDAKSRPYIEVKPRSTRQKKSTIQKTGEVLKGQKVYFYHDTTGTGSTAEFVDGNLQIKTPVGKTLLFTRYYYFPRRPRSWGDIEKMTQDLMRTGMRSGLYRMYNSIYGEIGESNELSQLMDVLQSVYSNYGKWLSGTLLGWVWTGDTFESSQRRSKKYKTIRERYRDTQRELKIKKAKQIKKRLSK
jgi:hypothetical protein